MDAQAGGGRAHHAHHAAHPRQALPDRPPQPHPLRPAQEKGLCHRARPPTALQVREGRGTSTLSSTLCHRQSSKKEITSSPRDHSHANHGPTACPARSMQTSEPWKELNVRQGLRGKDAPHDFITPGTVRGAASQQEEVRGTVRVWHANQARRDNEVRVPHPRLACAGLQAPPGRAEARRVPAGAWPPAVLDRRHPRPHLQRRVKQQRACLPACLAS